MNIAFTRSTEKGNKRRYKNSSGGVISPGTDHFHVAHIPEGTGFTLCGARVARLVEVEDDAEIVPCQVCKRRLEAAERKRPGSASRFLGNKLLPAPNM